MNKVLTLILALITLVPMASAAPDLRPGDILLQPLNCSLCSLIEAEENTIYSHIGVVLAVTPQVIIAEAMSSVRRQTLAEFQKKTEAGQRTLVMRFRNEKLSDDIEKSQGMFVKTFETFFEGAKYDHEFRWNNFDETGREKIYCSELVSKLFQAFVGIDTPIKRMHFRNNLDQWTRYFRGNIPEGQWGNSPADFHHSDLFYEVGEL